MLLRWSAVRLKPQCPHWVETAPGRIGQKRKLWSGAPLPVEEGLGVLSFGSGPYARRIRTLIRPSGTFSRGEKEIAQAASALGRKRAWSPAAQ